MSTDRAPSQMTLREAMTLADKLTKELTEHLDQSYCQKTHTLLKSAKLALSPETQGQVTDKTMRDLAEAILASDDFAQQLYGKLAEALGCIDQRVRRAREEG